MEKILLQLCPPLPEDPHEFNQLKRVIGAAFSRHVPEFEKAIGLEHPASQFRCDLIRAILICILTDRLPPERRSECRKKYLRVSKDAAVAAEAISRTAAGLNEIKPIPPGLVQFAQLGEQASSFAALSAVTARHAEMLIDDKGGPKGMVAFCTLVRGLARAFENATGRPAKVTWNHHSEDGERYEGRFVKLVEAVLPVVLQLVPNMPHPHSERARGKFIQKATGVRRQADDMAERPIRSFANY